MKEKIMDQYNIVFDKQENINLCGGETCMKLIHLLQEAGSATNFGDAKIGLIKVSNIKELFNKV